MRLSTRSRYGLRLMIALARSYGGGPRLLKEIADTEDLSEKYLGQLVIPLKSAGYISTVRGARGGYELGVDPAELTPLKIITVLEGDLFGAESIGPGSPGSLRVTAELWNRLNTLFAETLSSLTLADLALQSAERERQAPMYSI